MKEQLQAQAKYLHRDTNVTTQRLDQFAARTHAEQAEILGQLRKRAADDSHIIELTVMSIAIALLAMFVVPTRVDLTGLPLIGAFITGGAIGIFAVLILAPTLIAAAVRNSRREAATVWLGAFEDELQRRRGLRGRAARKWRAEH